MGGDDKPPKSEKKSKRSREEDAPAEAVAASAKVSNEAAAIATRTHLRNTTALRALHGWATYGGLLAPGEVPL
jgi:hypothetical protein